MFGAAKQRRRHGTQEAARPRQVTQVRNTGGLRGAKPPDRAIAKRLEAQPCLHAPCPHTPARSATVFRRRLQAQQAASNTSTERPWLSAPCRESTQAAWGHGSRSRVDWILRCGLRGGARERPARSQRHRAPPPLRCRRSTTPSRPGQTRATRRLLACPLHGRPRKAGRRPAPPALSPG